MYMSTHLSDSVLRIPDEDEELEVIHVLLKCTTPNLNIIGCYLDVESRQDNSTIERLWTKLVEVALHCKKFGFFCRNNPFEQGDISCNWRGRFDPLIRRDYSFNVTGFIEASLKGMGRM